MLDFTLVRERSPEVLADVLADHNVAVNRSGRARCPVHQGEDANMVVTVHKGLVHCKTCGFGGGVPELVAALDFGGLPKREGVVAALRQIAARLGMVDDGTHDVAPYGPFSPSAHPTPAPARPEPVDANLVAVRALDNPQLPDAIYARVLAFLKLGPAGVAFMERRGLDPQKAEVAGFRTIPDAAAWDTLRRAIRGAVRPAEARLAGLDPDRLPWGGRVGALLIPYVHGGRVLAMRFRALSPTIPKKDRYRSLTGAPSLCLPFGADAVDNCEGEDVHVTEGELDCFTLSSTYDLRAVGMPGTSPSKDLRERVARALRPAGRVIAWFDPDEAGETVGWAGFRDSLVAVNGAEWVNAKVIRRRPKDGLDVNDMHCNGGLGL